MIRNTHGGIFNPTFLDSIEPLYDLHMGAENMGPLLYTLAWFSKPKNILEIGAGYTSIFLLQALEDNAEEGRRYSHMISDGKAMIGDVPWVVKDYEFDRLTHSTLHIVDNCAARAHDCAQSGRNRSATRMSRSVACSRHGCIRE